MSECNNLDVRDLLPGLARGELKGYERAAAEAHLATCAACRAELDLVRDAATALRRAPPIDTSRIAEAVIRAARERHAVSVPLDAARRRPAASRRVWLAAASLMAVVGAGALAVVATRNEVGPGPVSEIARSQTPAPQGREPAEEAQRPHSPSPGSRAASGTELVMGGGVSDLADSDLESLLGVLEGIAPEFDVEPTVILPLLEGDV